MPHTDSQPARAPLRMPGRGDGVDTNAAVDALHRFHAGESSGEALDGAWRPALLAAWTDEREVRTAWPLLLDEHGGARLFAEAMQELVRGFAPGPEDARLLKDNLVRLERLVREQPSGPARRVLEAAGKALGERLQLKAPAKAKLDQELYCLLDALPERARLSQLSRDSALDLLLLAARRTLVKRREEHQRELERLRDRVRERIATEEIHDPARRTGEALARAVGPLGARLLDPGALAQVVDQRRGTQRLAPERLARLRAVLAALEGADLRSLPLLVVVHTAARAPELGAGAQGVIAEDPVLEAMAQLDLQAAALARTLRAARAATLELADAYVPGRHDAVLAALDWQAFRDEELLLLPRVVVLDEAGRAARESLGALVRLLTAGRPALVLLETLPGRDPLADGGGHDVGASRLELGQLAMALREPLVQQASTTRPEPLLAFFEVALGTTRPSLHLLIGAPEGAGASPWFHAEAAVEGRAHPLFRYDPDWGEGLARRFDLGGNPAPEADWSRGPLAATGPAGEARELELAFTFADYALLDPRMAPEFCPVPAGVETDLVPVEEWLGLPAVEAQARIPYLWAADGRGGLGRLALSRRLAFACRDRLETWHQLQELAGIHSAYVERAVESARDALRAQHTAELEALRAAHEAELSRVRLEEAGEAMARLAATLVQDGVGLMSLPTPRPAPGAGTAPAPAAEAPATPVPAAPAEEEEAVVLAEPWIDAVLCTSCNDCININPLMFGYNELKQARIADVTKGTFEQLVRAAEKCPSRCIHPGKPQNPAEPGLEALVARAAAFQ